MELKKVTPEMKALLQKPLPAAAISKHPTKTYLSSIKAIYVTERLNEVFGIGSWRFESRFVEKIDGMIVVYSTLFIPEYGIELSSFGGNDNGGSSNKNFDLGDAYKGASTDALTKICSWLEIGIDVFKGFGSAPAPKQEPKPNNQKTRTELAQTPYVDPIIAGAEPHPVTMEQKTRILLLLNHSAISQSRKEKTVSALNNGYYNSITVEEAIEKIQEIINKAQPSNAA